MSHFSQIKTQLSDERYLLQALRELGFQPEEGEVQVRGFANTRSPVEIRIRSKAAGYDVGFLKEGDRYVCVADWYGVRGIKQETFLQTLTQRYAYCVTKDKLKSQGFAVAAEQRIDGQIHVLLRRMS